MNESRTREGPPPTDPFAPAAAFISRVIGPLLAGTGAFAALAAIVLSVEKVRSLEDPSYVPSCSIDEVLSCGSVIVSDQAEAFGFPNPFIGIAGFAAVATIGIALIGGARLADWLWLTVQVGMTFAFGFVVWLIFHSVYRIEALCPYCMVVWAMTIIAFVYVTAHNVAESRLPFSAQLRPLWVGYHGVLVTVLLLLVCGVLAQRFWDHWQDVL